MPPKRPDLGGLVQQLPHQLWRGFLLKKIYDKPTPDSAPEAVTIISLSETT
jgi:hypothetical protein